MATVTAAYGDFLKDSCRISGLKILNRMNGARSMTDEEMRVAG